MTLPRMLLDANELGIRLEMVNGLPLWEAQPVYRHQKAIDRIVKTIRPVSNAIHPCGCIYAIDVYIQIGNNLIRPDITIFCQEPPDDQQDSALTIMPEAVIEVVSKGYETKDLHIAPPFYLSHGIKDVIVFDPATLLVLHLRQHHATRLISPVELTLECGCQVTV